MENIRIEKKGNISVLTITRPKQLNALNRQTLEELSYALDEVSASGETKCLIITGEGEKAFVGGADIAEMSNMTESEAKEFSSLGNLAFSKIEFLRFPVIAAVNGYALGGGCELALACDIILASEKAVFAQPEVSLGVIPGFGGTQRLAMRVGLGRAKKMIFTGEYVKAKEAFDRGLADQLVQPENLMEEATALAAKIASQPAGAIFAAKAAIPYASTIGLEKGLELETELFSRCFTLEEQKNAMQAFLQRKK